MKEGERAVFTIAPDYGEDVDSHTVACAKITTSIILERGETLLEKMAP